jgi:hypothetical protein
MAPKPRKYAIYGTKTPIFWTQTPHSRKMKKLNLALETGGDRLLPPHR